MKKLIIIKEILAEFEEWINLNTNEKLTLKNKEEFEVIIGSALGCFRADEYNPLIIGDMRDLYHSTLQPCAPEDSIDAVPYGVKLVVDYGFDMDPRSRYSGSEISLYDVTRNELSDRLKNVQRWILKSDFETQYKTLESKYCYCEINIKGKSKHYICPNCNKSINPNWY